MDTIIQFFYEYFLFFFKTITLVVLVLFVVITIVSNVRRMKIELADKGGFLMVKSFNEKLEDYNYDLMALVLTNKQEFKKHQKAKKEEKKKHHIKENTTKKKVFVLKFDGDVEASAVSALREEITAILSFASTEDEVVICLESPGGMVNSYGLVASQLQRIRDKEVALTVCVDNVAASGGYLVACVANKIISAPFAIIGSIGVLMQIPNFNKVLKKYDVDYEQLTSGKYKRTLTMFGENTDDGRKKMQEDLEITHSLFKNFITKYRPEVNIEEVGDGSIWYGQQAVEKKLVDSINTSDAYLTSMVEDGSDVYLVSYEEKKTISDRFSRFLGKASSSIASRFTS